MPENRENASITRKRRFSIPINSPRFDRIVLLALVYHSLATAAVFCRPFMTHDTILTLPEVAELLRVAEKTVYTLAQRGEIPAFKVGGQWRFSRGAIEVWIEKQSLSAHQPVTNRPSSAVSGAPTADHAAKAKTRRRR